MRSIFTFIILLCALNLQAQQDSIILLNGKSYLGKIISDTAGVVKYFEQNSPDTIEITTDRIFSYTTEKGEKVFYVPNEFLGDYLTVDEVRFATIGSYDARVAFKPRFVFYSSLVLGLGISILDTYYTQAAYDRFVAQNLVPPTNATVGFFGARPTVVPILLPITLSACWGLPSFRIKDHQLLHRNMYGNENYYRGFHRIAKQKRIFAAIKGSLIGISAGMISYFIFTPN